MGTRYDWKESGFGVSNRATKEHTHRLLAEAGNDVRSRCCNKRYNSFLSKVCRTGRVYINSARTSARSLYHTAVFMGKFERNDYDTERTDYEL